MKENQCDWSAVGEEKIRMGSQRNRQKPIHRHMGYDQDGGLYGGSELISFPVKEYHRRR